MRVRGARFGTVSSLPSYLPSSVRSSSHCRLRPHGKISRITKSCSARARIVIASLVAYWCGEFANSFVMARMKVLTEGKHLWMRTIGSTAVGQAVDTLLVITIIFAGTVPISTMLTLMVSGYTGKVLYEALATPLTYAVVNWLKRVEGVDIMDTDTDFNPFKAKLAPH